MQQLKDQYMQERLSEAIANQSKLMDTFAQQLLVVEIAIPGLYATSLKLVTKSGYIGVSWNLYIVFFCWILAVTLTILAMLPRPYKDIDTNNRQAIETFFEKAAQHKRRLLIPSLVLFFSGILTILLGLPS